ncbi:MAG: T9SS type A sorting domain-containing protein, partial [candidate division Zixibacteria bacterium]|nr:T9SS type A sorting domain-containing protein [candidate division Zixibacteria bacterium]
SEPCNLSIESNIGTFTTTMSNFDQVAQIVAMGGTVTQLGGGDPGKNLLAASDFVPPVNTQSGVSVSLPGYGFVGSVIDAGTFPTGTEPGNSANLLLSTPTDLTFTTPGSGGPDGSDGDGSVAFTSGDYVELSFDSVFTACNGSPTDFVIYTNSASGGNVEFIFSEGATVNHVDTVYVPGGTAGSGLGGVTLDLPDGIRFDRFVATGLSGTAEIDGFAARGPLGASSTEICFYADTTGHYEVIVTATDSCGQVGADTSVVWVELNEAPTCQFTGGQSPPLCTPPVHVVTFSTFDPNGDSLTCTNTNPNATLGDGIWEYSPSPGEHVVDTITCTDPCGESCQLIIDITFPNPAPPVCDIPSDTTIYLCDPIPEVCLPVSATGGALCQIASGPGTLSAGQWCYTPASDGTVNVDILCAAECDTCTGSFAVTFVLNDPDSCCQPPVISCPADVTVECDSPTDPGTLGSATATGNCAPITITHTDSEAAGTCAQEKVITREWVATNSAGQADTCIQTITVDDTTPPVISCPADVTFECDAVGSFGTATATDNCDANPTISIISRDSTAGGCDQEYTLVLTYEASDACGNTSTCQQTITVEDTTDPTIACPADITVDCEADVPAADINLVTASDNCGSVTVTHEGDSPLTGGSCGGSITRTYRATDACGNFVECTQTITVNDQTDPTITCPADVTVDCVADVPAADINLVTATDNCGSVTVTHEGDSPLSGGPCGGTITRTYRATDECGNFVECTQTITINDQTDPTIACPADITVDCEADVPVADINLVTADDNCGSVTVTHEGDTPLSGGACGGTIVRTYRATDACGNFVECAQTITVNDQTDPTIACPADITVDCETDVPAPDINLVTADDNCGSVTVTHEGDTQLSGGPCGGTITRTYRATDECGNFVECTQTITVDDQTDPTIACPADVTVECESEVPSADINLVTASDNCGSVTVTHEGDSLVSVNNCDARITRTYRATDECGNFAECIQTITIDDTTRPVWTSIYSDTTISLCAPQEICLPLSATDNCGDPIFALLGSPGTITDDPWQYCYTPTGNETITVRLQAQDHFTSCVNAAVQEFTITFEINSAPECDLPSDTSLFLCSPGQVCLPVSATDIDGNLADCQVVSGPGSIAGGQWCYNATTDESFTVTVECTDACGQSCQGSFNVDIDINEAPVCSGPGDVVLERCDLTEIVLNVSATDGDGNLNGCQVVSGPGTISGGAWTFTPPDFGEYCVTVECTDACGASCQETFCVTVEHRTDCDCLIDISVNGGANIDAFNEQTVTVPITIDAIQADIEVGGFDLLLCYDQTAIQIVDVARGLAIEEWEYFTYRHGVNSNCTGACPSGIVRLVGIADLDNGPDQHPSEGSFRPVGTIAELSFFVTPDRNFIGQCVPIAFCTYDCGDNTVSSRTGDTLYVDLYNFDPGCQNNPKADVLPSLCFLDASICIQEPPDDRGDLNLNFIANEVGDAVLYSRYFIEGLDVFHENDTTRAVQILASDINDDGVTLTVADLVYLIRIITGDAQPFPADPGTPKLAPYAANATASLRIEDGRAVVSTTADVDLGGAFLVFRYSDLQPQRPVLTDDASPLKVSSRASSGEMRVLVSPEMTGKEGAIASGSTDLLSIPFEGEGSIELTEVQFSDANGAILSSEIAKSSALLPTSYQLYQNYPNPFNAGTVIRFDLQEASDWTLTVYNVTGQRVRTFHGHSEASQMTVQWNGRDDNGQSVASGVYFYNIKAGRYTDTRKMTVLK